MIGMFFKLIKSQSLTILKRASHSSVQVMAPLNTPPKELKINTAYGHLAVKLWNNGGKKTPILALHGWMDNAGTWDNLCPLLDEDHPIYALDFPGHGFSSHPPLGLATYFTDHLVTIDKVVQHFNWKQVILLGHSMGGGASLLYSGTKPDLIEKLIVIDIFRPITVEIEDQPSNTAASLHELIKVKDTLKSNPPRYSYEEIVKKLVQSYGESVTEEAAKILLVRNSRRHENGKYSFSHSPMLKVKSSLAMTFEQQKAYFSKITCDMMLIKSASSPIYGTNDQAKEVLNSYKRTSQNFVFEVIEGTHHLHLVNPAPVAEIINKFLHGLPQSEESKIKSNNYIASML